MSHSAISTEFPCVSRYIEVDGSKLHYLEQGTGDPILLLHGIPTSSYLWRNIMPHLAKLGRCIAPDLIGMGKSDKPNIEYSILDHTHYIERFIETLHLKSIMLVLHCWGSLIGFDYAMRHEKNCKGLVFYESYFKPLRKDDIPLLFQEQIFLLEEHKKIEGIQFVEQVMGQAVLNSLNEQIFSVYREPFTQKGSEKPLLRYLQDLNTVNDFINRYAEKLKNTNLPKLLLYSMPGFITPFETVIWAKNNLSNIEIADIGEALHYAQEANPFLMGETISVWLQGVEQQ